MLFDGDVGLVVEPGVLFVSVCVVEVGCTVVAFDEVDSVVSEVGDVIVLDSVLGPGDVVFRVLVV